MADKNQNGYSKSTSDSFHQLTKQMQHEQLSKQEDHSHARNCLIEEHSHEINILEKKLGIVGKLFGTQENASKNIAATVLIVLLIGGLILSGIAYCCYNDIDFIKTIWQTLIPVITLALGYIFGKQ